MKSEKRGMITLDSLVSNISLMGFWLLIEDKEYFVPFADYPIFQKATIEQIFSVEQIAPGQLHWRLLDADIELDALEHPDKFPLVWQS
jgi:hypothetical protein